MNFISKVFGILAKPAKWIFIGGAFAYALWFAIMTGMSIDGQPMNVLTNIITLFVGTALICLPPVFALIGKNELAKLFFVFLLGYWVLTAPREYFFLAEGLADAREFYPVFVSIFFFFIGLAIIGLLILVILSMIIKLKILHVIANFMGIAVVAVCFLTAILFIIEAAIQGAPWTVYIEYGVMDLMVLPITIGCGCLYFFDLQKENQ